MASWEVLEGGRETNETGEHTTGGAIVDFVATAAAEPDRKPRLFLDILKAK